jgi:class 3 adenylate cyclase
VSVYQPQAALAVLGITLAQTAATLVLVTLVGHLAGLMVLLIGFPVLAAVLLKQVKAMALQAAQVIFGQPTPLTTAVAVAAVIPAQEAYRAALVAVVRAALASLAHTQQMALMD